MVHTETTAGSSAFTPVRSCPMARSAPPSARFAAAIMATVLAAVGFIVPVLCASAVTGDTTATPEVAPPLFVSLVASAPAVPAGGTFGYTAQIRLNERASYLQTVLEVSRSSGALLFKRTRVGNNLEPGLISFSFERGLTDALDLEPDEYPVRLTTSAMIGGSTVSTETTATLRVYNPKGTRLKAALIVSVTGQPLSGPDGRFAIDPAQATGTRDAVGRIARRVLADSRARVSLSVPPILLSEWRRLSGGYTLASGVSVRPTDTVPAAYNATLADLSAAIETGRLDLCSAGYADPNLTDLVGHALSRDIGPQYDAGISALFASLQTTPSPVTMPAGACVPTVAVTPLAEKGVRFIVVDDDCARFEKDTANAGIYPLPTQGMFALVAEKRTTTALSRGDFSIGFARAFARMLRNPKEPIVFRVDVDGDANASLDTVGAALNALESQPWLEMSDAESLRPPAQSAQVLLVGGPVTPGAPNGYWKSVSSARRSASAYYAALGPADPDAATAEAQSLVAEGSMWSGPSGTWARSSRGLGYATAALTATRPILDAVSVKAEPLTFSGASGDVPVTIVNGSQKTLAVVVKVTAGSGLRVRGETSIPMTLRPQENYLEIPVEILTSLSGRLTIDVQAGGVSLGRKNVVVKASYLDRIALGAGAVVALLVMLFLIIRRSRSDADENDDSRRRARARYTVPNDGHDQAGSDR